MRSIVIGLGVCWALGSMAANAQDSAAPRVTLGRPEAVAPAEAESAAPRWDAQVRPVGFDAPAYTARRPQGADGFPPPLGAPAPGGAAPAVSNEPYNCGVVSSDAGGKSSLWDRICHPFKNGPFNNDGRQHWFESDHSFDSFISPVTNPFYFEDPRSITELRPIFIYQASPTGNPVFHGGDIEFFGVQGRVAFTERFSLVVNKFGAIWSEPHNGDADFQPHGGFAELWIGPKYTFLRNENTKTLGAFGLTFEIPAGDSKVQQNTGSLSLVPYVSMAQNFWCTSYGSFNAMGTLGYSAGLDSNRSDHLFTSLHLDYDVGNLHKIYPLMELHWFYYTKNGNSRELNFEGADLFNFGATQISGHSDFNLALGMRYKFNDHFQLGFAAETPLTAHNQLQDWRITADMIFRY